jgi:hypothetical protein
MGERKQRIITMLVVLALIGVVGFFGARISGVPQRLYLSSIAQQFAVDPSSTMVVSGYFSDSYYFKFIRTEGQLCEGNSFYERVYYSENTIDEIRNFYLQDITAHGLSEDMPDPPAVYAMVNSQTEVAEIPGVPNQDRLPPFDLANVEATHRTVYTLRTLYYFYKCFQFP